MKYTGMPSGMWLLFAGSFRKQLVRVLKYDAAEAKGITAKARLKYREVISSLPEFERADAFKMNIVNCALFSAFLLGMPERPSLPDATAYIQASMMTSVMKAFCRLRGKKKFSEADINDMKARAALRAADRNPYSWNMEFLPYPDGSGYEARFSRCGICALMTELGLTDLIPAMCSLDYSMSEAGGAADFVREHTLATGGTYCDNGFRRKTVNDDHQS